VSVNYQPLTVATESALVLNVESELRVYRYNNINNSSTSLRQIRLRL